MVTTPLPHTYLSEADLPKEYDIRDLEGVSYASIDRNQHIPQYCGSCWTQSSASALSDRLALLTNNVFPEVDLAPQVRLCICREQSGKRLVHLICSSHQIAFAAVDAF